ncbi:ATP-grasp domain-containing protein [Candidatus Dojkabacteria bacterium]|uniref:ATP-grasp domain-containing protein n=1 Tax=Candidatus Dojkabacteria bacterium TaxID=2099670 RepID=A0A955L8E0_9BACT|nr:ATP-grasp domain-containing protein [Candidatus Dojkabacteria bacterium]
MYNLEELVSKIEQKRNGKTILYVSNEVEHGVGLSDYLENVIHICLKHSNTVDYLKEEGKTVICFDSDIPNHTARSSADLLQIIPTLKEQGIVSDGDYVQTFKISPKFEFEAETHKLVILNTSSELNQLFERKVSQANLFEKELVCIPKTRIGQLDTFSYDDCAEYFGNKFVIQFDRGHTGSGTRFISSEEEFKPISEKFPKRSVRISEYVEGDTYSVNCCMSSSGVLIGGIYRQITGIPELTSNRGGTVGGTFQHGLLGSQLDALGVELLKIEKLLGNYSYKGLFGLDFIVSDDTVYIIEMNARQQMTVAFNSHINVMQKIPPLNLLHIAVFLGIDTFEIEEINRYSTREIHAGQLYLRNTHDSVLKVSHEKKTGVYSLETGEFIKTSYQFSDCSEGEILLLTQLKGTSIKPEGEVARIQGRNLLDENGFPLKSYIDFLTRINQ